tara:strand:- start:74 stop:460 length:387 start_codon:yes stop_codon:yes gene_type:complete
MEIKVSVSAGELIDKITILEIKSEKLSDKEKLKNVSIELSVLNSVLKDHELINEKIENFKAQLKNVNLKLWNIEDQIRIFEKNKNFNSEFIELARSVYIQNDLRFSIKNKINLSFNSKIVEVKDYENY